MSYFLSPSILSADFANLKQAILLLDESPADWVHIDVMDGSFVPNISFGLPVISAIRPYTKKPFDVHLMMERPERYIEDFKKAGADILTIHYEASTHLHRSLTSIREAGMKTGLALNPHTPASVVEPIIDLLDVILVMSVNPGFPSQAFIPSSLRKISEIKQMALARQREDLIIEVDGGIKLNNAAEVLRAGAHALVAGSAVFGSDDPVQAAADFKAVSVDKQA